MFQQEDLGPVAIFSSRLSPGGYFLRILASGLRSPMSLFSFPYFVARYWFYFYREQRNSYSRNFVFMQVGSFFFFWLTLNKILMYQQITMKHFLKILRTEFEFYRIYIYTYIYTYTDGQTNRPEEANSSIPPSLCENQDPQQMKVNIQYGLKLPCLLATSVVKNIIKYCRIFQKATTLHARKKHLLTAPLCKEIFFLKQSVFCGRC